MSNNEITDNDNTTNAQRLEIQVNHIYRAKTPRDAHGFFNDRQVLYVSPTFVQYDSPSVTRGRHYPKVGLEKFQDWAGRDVTDEMPKNEWMDWARK